MVEAVNMCKTYDNGKIEAVKDVSFKVRDGELFGLIGPDGAGKTSIFRMLTTLLLPESGRASVGGYDIVNDYKAIRKSVGYMPGQFSLYQDLSVEENLQFFATLFATSITKNYDLVKAIYTQLEPFKTRKAGALSGGMKQKLALCCTLIHRPEVLFLDEPTTGVDAVSRKEFWEMLKDLKQYGITILVSTPYMDEAALCERIGLIQDGEILSIDPPKTIIDQYPDPLYAINAKDMGQLLRDLNAAEELKSCNAFGASHHIVFKENTETMRQKLIADLKAKNHENIELARTKPTIEDCFIQLMTVEAL